MTFLFEKSTRQIQWHMTVIVALRRLRQEDWPGQLGLHSEALSIKTEELGLENWLIV